MYKKLVIVALVLSIVLIFFGCTQNPQSLFKTFKSDQLGISFNYDSNLFLEDNGTSVRLIDNQDMTLEKCELRAVKNLITDVQDSFERDVTIYGDQDAAKLNLNTNLTLENYRAYMLLNPKERTTNINSIIDANITILEDKFVDIGGTKAWRWSAKSPLAKDLETAKTELVFIKDRYLYEISGGPRPHPPNSSDFNICYPYINQIISSLNIIS